MSIRTHIANTRAQKRQHLAETRAQKRHGLANIGAQKGQHLAPGIAAFGTRFTSAELGRPARRAACCVAERRRRRQAPSREACTTTAGDSEASCHTGRTPHLAPVMRRVGAPRMVHIHPN